MNKLATIEDVNILFRPLSPQESEKAEALIDVVSNMLRLHAEEVRIDLDDKVKKNEAYKSVVKSVIVDIVSRALMSSTNSEPMTQFSQAALGYSISGTYFNPGGGVFIKRDELKRLGLKKQRYGAIDIYDVNSRDNCNFNK